MKQAHRILLYLQKNKSITTLDGRLMNPAIIDVGRRIRELKTRGIDFTETEHKSRSCEHPGAVGMYKRWSLSNQHYHQGNTFWCFNPSNLGENHIQSLHRTGITHWVCFGSHEQISLLQMRFIAYAHRHDGVKVVTKKDNNENGCRLKVTMR